MISYKNEICKFNFRVAAIIYNEDKTKIFVQQSNRCPFCVFPGGRVEELENSYDAIKREIKEELNITIDCNLIKIAENFFELDNTKYHELCYFYIVTNIVEKEIYNIKDEFIGPEGIDSFRWVDIKEFKTLEFQPKYIKEDVINKNFNLKNIIVNEL